MRELFDDFHRDVRQAFRLWRSNAGLSLTVLTTLGLSVGVATSIFTFVDVLLLRELPVRAPRQLFAVASEAGSDLNLNPRYFSLEFFRQLTSSDPTFRDLMASSVVVSSGVNLSTEGVAERVRAELVSGNYFRVLGRAASIGRTIAEQDDSVGSGPVVVLSDAAWRLRFGGRSDIVGRTIRLNGRSCTVIGVMGREFFGTRVGLTPDLWAPLSMTPQMAGDPVPSRDSNYIELMMRVTPPASLAAVEGALALAYQDRIRTTSPTQSIGPAQPQQPSLRLVPAAGGLSLLRGQYRQPLVILLSAVALLLIIACANIANLLLARGLARRREMAIRVSQGATWTRMIRQLITESLVMTFAGGLLSWAIAIVLGQGLLAYLPGSSAAAQFSPDVRAFVFTFGLVTLAGVAFGMVPGRIAARLDVNLALRRDSDHGGSLFRRVDAQTVVSGLQVALSLVLLVAWLLFARSLHNIRSVDTGFAKESIVLAALDPVRSSYSQERARVFYDELLTRLRTQPGVRAAGLASHGSLSGVLAPGTRFMNTPMHADRQQLPASADATVYFNSVTPGYFDAVGMVVRRGRDFTPRDDPRAPRVAIVNDTAVRYFFGDADPIGRRIGSGRTGPAEIEVIGVVNDAKYLNLREEAPRIVYRPHAQAFLSLMTLHVRSETDSGALATLIQQEVHGLDASLPVFQVQTMRQRVDDSLRQERLVTAVATALSLLGTLLALLGVFSVVNYSVTTRSRELAVRIALGAQPRQILSEVLSRAVLTVLSGVIIGLPIAIVSMRLYQTILYGITGTSTPLIAAAILSLMLIGLGAGCLPARRAVRIDPMLALRND
jgi:predicted permease